MKLYKYTAISSLDSLKTALRLVQHKADSLQLAMVRFDGKVNSFDQIIYLQLTVFIVIITILLTIGGLIAWTAVVKPFTTRLNLLNEAIALQKSEIGETINTELAAIKESNDAQIKSLNATKSQAIRAMFYIAKNEKWHYLTFMWGLRLFATQVKSTSKSWETLMNEIIASLDYVEEASELKPFSREIEKLFEAIVDKKDKRFDEKLNLIKAKYYTLLNK
jgi:hypothetical protein